jgi:aspartate/methionine/tyrosine aminotransferase
MTDQPSQHRVARQVAGARLSAIKEMSMLAAEVEDVASLSWGLPSFATPEPIREAVTRAFASDPDIGKYALPNGLPELRSLAAEEHARKTGIEPDPDENVFITAGNMQGMSTLFHVLLEPGDEIILTDPGFASHYEQVRLRGGVPIAWPLDERNAWAMDTDLLESLVTERTRAVVLVNPSNPTGSLFSKRTLLRLGEIARARDLLLIIDDPYSELIYEDRERYFNLAAEPGLSDQLAYLFTFSKIHAMSGWRLGYMILPDWLRAQVLKVHDANLICTPRISQVAGIAALSGDQAHVGVFREVLSKRRDLICERLDALPHVFSYVQPEGAYYVFPRILVETEDSWSFSRRLLEETRVCVTPGIAFGPGSDAHVRMAFCVDEDVIDKAFDRIAARYPA